MRLMAWYLGVCARHITNRATKNTPIIAITGSTGKTSTKEAMGELMREKVGADVLVSPGNLNNEIGLPLAILGFTEVPSFWQYPAIKIQSFWRALTKPPASAYVLEYGIDHPGDMDNLISIARPTTAIITNISSVHREYFSSPEEHIKEKMKLAQSVVEGGTVYINSDDSHLEGASKNISAQVKTYGKKEGSDIRLVKFELEKRKTEFTTLWQGKEEKYEINALGRQHVMSVLPVIMFAKCGDMSSQQLASVLLRYEPLPGRGNIIRGKLGTTIINETYNANPLSTRMALEVIGKMKLSPKIAVLGDMLELGERSHIEHEEILKLAREKVDIVISVGPRMKAAHLADKSFNDPIAAAQYLGDHLERDAVILVKGSQGMRMEKVVEEIMQDKSQAINLLPRQSAGWLKTPFRAV